MEEATWRLGLGEQDRLQGANMRDRASQEKGTDGGVEEVRAHSGSRAGHVPGAGGAAVPRPGCGVRAATCTQRPAAPTIHVHPEPQTVTLLGNRAFADVIR